MTDELELTTDETPEDSEQQIQQPFNKELLDKQTELAQSALKEIESTVQLTDEEKKQIEENKKKKGKKAEKTEEEQIVDLQSDLDIFINKHLKMELGDGIIEKLPTGIDLLDTILGGGFGVGCFSIICGNPGTFKSALLCQIIAASQEKYKKKLFTTYHDSESAMTTERLANLGVKNPKIRPYDDVTIESIFKVIETICTYKALKNIVDVPAIVAWDSIANTSTERERTTDDINATIGLKARLISALFPRYLPKMRENKISLIAINQLREKLTMGPYAPAADLKYMGNKEMPGGQALKFNAFHLLHLQSRSDIKYEQYGFNGIILEAKCIKNKFFSPNVPIRMVVDFNNGVSNFWTNYLYLVDNKKIQASAWSSLIALPEVKFRTKDAIENYSTNPKFKEIFDKEVQDTINTEILSKYK